jgi:hypothetical protein
VRRSIRKEARRALRGWPIIRRIGLAGAAKRYSLVSAIVIFLLSLLVAMASGGPAALGFYLVPIAVGYLVITAPPYAATLAGWLPLAALAGRAPSRRCCR